MVDEKWKIKAILYNKIVIFEQMYDTAKQNFK